MVKLHHGLKCDRHQSLFTNNGERDSNEEYIIDSTPDLKKTLFDPAKEESISNIYRQTSSTTIDLQALTIQESADDQEVITPKTDNAETASFLLSPSEMCLCRPHPQAVGCDTDHCKTLTNLELVIYGIGNFAECIIARYQLALMLALQNTLKVIHNLFLALMRSLCNPGLGSMQIAYIFFFFNFCNSEFSEIKTLTF